MGAKELMIGDWANFLVDTAGGETREDPMTNEYQPMKIVSLSSWYNNDGEVESAEGVISDIEKLNPTPLTPEILEKNGFIGGEYKSYTGYVWYLEEKGFSKIWFIMSCEKSILCGEKIKANGSIGDNFSIPNIKFVHELQHALKICGIDKDIEI